MILACSCANGGKDLQTGPCMWVGGQGPIHRSLAWHKTMQKSTFCLSTYIPARTFRPERDIWPVPLPCLKMPGNSSASGSKPGFGNILEIEKWLKPYVSDPGFMSMYPADRSYAKRDADTLSSNNFEKMVREGSYNLTKIYRPPNHLLEDV